MDMLETAGDIVSSFSLSSCVRCGKCYIVCPSRRNGGIHPDEVVFGLIDSDPSMKISEVGWEVWKCLMCHRCTMNCPKKIDVTGAIRMLRYASAASGDPPKRFTAVSETLAKEGRAFPVNDAANKKREELGLDALTKDGEAVGELNTIMKRTGFCFE
ncbi:MAG: 4Fe-4S dicluster domain-containing protein [Methanomassiliicoccaceae archaeon]|nr:4Fe-4S dicluster domain-containing protein [Methanomassiliicoccaceae archaeon]